MRREQESTALDNPSDLLEVLRAIPDLRRRQGRSYALCSLLAVSACAVLSGARSIQVIAGWAAVLSKPMLRRLGVARLAPPSKTARR